MKLLFRADASAVIGTGHVMRCLTLANEGKKKGGDSCFVLRRPDKRIVETITSFGHQVIELEPVNSPHQNNNSSLAHADWSLVSQDQDANETIEVIHRFKPDWVVVDHYGLDATWLSIIPKNQAKIFVIDDLGDRDLICELLLDQNLGASAKKYEKRVPKNCNLLLGTKFSLLRSDFRAWRGRSLNGRFDRDVERVLVTMGGSDAENYTLRVLKELAKSRHAKNSVFTVVVGGAYLHRTTLNQFVGSSGLNISVLENVNNMAEIMSNSELCIGASGSTVWERCCLGLPSITLSIAKNQNKIAEELSKRNVSIYSTIENLLIDFEKFFGNSKKELLKVLIENSCQVCDGFGADRVLKELEKRI